MELPDKHSPTAESRLRPLTFAECAVLRAAIARMEGGERARIRIAGVPRSTYQSVRKRALDLGWLCTREVPLLAPAGITNVRVLITHPFGEHHAAALDVIQHDPATVLAWSTMGTLFAVSFLRQDFETGGDRAPTGRFGEIPPDWFGKSWAVDVTPSTGAFPIFVDFEGAWSKGILGKNPVSYPQALVFRDDGSTGTDTRNLGIHGSSFRDYLSHTDGQGAGHSEAWSGLIVRARGRRFHRMGWVTRRDFLIPWNLPSFPQVPFSQVVFLTGKIRRAESVERELMTIFAETGVSPFLCAYDTKRVLLGALAIGIQSKGSRPPVLPALQSTLAEIEIIREPINEMISNVNFRFGLQANRATRHASPS